MLVNARALAILDLSMKSITLLNPHYDPEITTPAKRATETSRYLRSQGWQVTVFAPAPNYPLEKVYEGYGDRWIDVRDEQGIRVVRLRPWIAKKSNLIVRFMSEIYFSTMAFFWVLFHKTDVVYATCPYMLLGPISYLAAFLRRARFVWEIRDLTWRYIATTGKRTFGAEYVLKKLMLWTARRADALVTTTSGQREYFQTRHSAPAQSAVIPNGVSKELIEALATPETEIDAAEKPEDSEFRVVYVGLLGYPQGLSTIVEAAKLVPEATFHFVGDGAEREKLESIVESLQLSNVCFHGFVGFSTVVEHYKQADLLTASLRNKPVFEVTQPSKIWEYMTAGKAIVYSGAGEAANVIQSNEAGVVVPPEDSEALAEAIRSLQKNDQLRLTQGRNGRKFATENLAREQILPRLNELLLALP